MEQSILLSNSEYQMKNPDLALLYLVFIDWLYCDKRFRNSCAELHCVPSNSSISAFLSHVKTGLYFMPNIWLGVNNYPQPFD